MELNLIEERIVIDRDLFNFPLSVVGFCKRQKEGNKGCQSKL